jgi:putative molybdopterin biosynthesis protein
MDCGLWISRLLHRPVDIAQAIPADHADCGIATRIATAANPDFVPVAVERFDLCMRQRDSYRPPLQQLLDVMPAPRSRRPRRRHGGHYTLGTLSEPIAPRRAD